MTQTISWGQEYDIDNYSPIKPRHPFDIHSSCTDKSRWRDTSMQRTVWSNRGSSTSRKRACFTPRDHNLVNKATIPSTKPQTRGHDHNLVHKATPAHTHPTTIAFKKSASSVRVASIHWTGILLQKLTPFTKIESSQKSGSNF